MEMQLTTDILVVGGGVGGCAAALGALALGHQVILTEATDWLGGQLTSQAVPPDEHSAIERCGCTRRYRQFRDGVRQYYRDHYPLTRSARAMASWNPGQGLVSRLAHEPRVALAVLEHMLARYQASGQLRTLLRHQPVAVDVEKHVIRSVMLEDQVTRHCRTISAKYILDATELGDLLPLASVEYVTGAESRQQTQEPHAVNGPPEPENVQAFTWCAALAYDPTPGASHVIDKPEQYTRWRDYVPRLTPAWPGRLLSWIYTDPRTLAPISMPLFAWENPDGGRRSWFAYRQIVCGEQFDAPQPICDATIVNWPQNDYLEGNLIDKPAELLTRYLHEARQLSLSLVYWMQTEAPRADGKTGYPGLHLRPDLTGTDDGLAKSPYIRESRRIRALFTVTENHVGREAREGHEAEIFPDSIGIGCYPIDLHPSATGRNYVDVPASAFQIPLGALVPRQVRNLLPACKNIGTTHITNGCYRLHPVEWNVGEAAGLLAAFCLDQKTQPHAVYEAPAQRVEFQNLLVKQGIELSWPQMWG